MLSAFVQITFHPLILFSSEKVQNSKNCLRLCYTTSIQPLYTSLHSSKISSLDFANPNYQSTDNVYKFKRKQPPDIWAMGRGNIVTLLVTSSG